MTSRFGFEAVPWSGQIEAEEGKFGESAWAPLVMCKL